MLPEQKHPTDRADDEKSDEVNGVQGQDVGDAFRQRGVALLPEVQGAEIVPQAARGDKSVEIADEVVLQ